MNINASISGILNAFKREDITAQNVANLNTKGYKAKYVANQASEDGGVNGVVKTDNNQAAKNGNNVGLAQEMINNINNLDQEKANINVLRSQNKMIGSLIDIKS